MTELLTDIDRPIDAHDGTDGTDGLDLLAGPGLRPAVMADFRKHIGSVLTGVFGGVLFDEVARVPIAASVDHTGRFRENFTDRALRSGFSGQAILADAAQRRKHARWLIDQHRTVRGTGVGEYDGVRYSALDPDLWLWIIASAVHAILVAFPVVTGHTLRPAEKEAAYQYLRHLFGELELPSRRGKLPATAEEFDAYYDKTVATELEANGFLRHQFATLTRLPLPSLLLPKWMRPVLTPPWLVVRPVAGRVVQVCSAKTMHPDVLAMIGFELKPHHDAEFALYSALLQLAWRVLPDRLKLEPIHYNRVRLDALRARYRDTARGRARYERSVRRLNRQNTWLARFYDRYGLETFAVPEGRSGGCPFG